MPAGLALGARVELRNPSARLAIAVMPVVLFRNPMPVTVRNPAHSRLSTSTTAINVPAFRSLQVRAGCNWAWRRVSRPDHQARV